MKPNAHAQRRSHQESRETSVGRPAPAGQVALVGLSDDQKLVLDCLERTGAGLTVKQLHSALSFPPDALRSALDGLLERKLVVRLNTVIPSYCCRYPGLGARPE
jgi:hypothetical protein